MWPKLSAYDLCGEVSMGPVLPPTIEINACGRFSHTGEEAI